MKTAIAALLLSATVQAQLPTLVPADFAYGITMQPQSDRAFCRVDLPAVVYEGITRSDVGDLRVFNAAGETVPYAFLPHVQASQQAKQSPNLPIFPIMADRDGAA